MADNITLLELLGRVKNSLAMAPDLRFQWLTAEVIDLRASGHVYFSLIQKDIQGRVIAKVQANMWRNVAISLGRKYGEKMRETLANGNEVRVLCSVTFHEQYGLSVNVSDIDIDYRKDTTRLQAEILAALKAENLLDLNKSKVMPWPVQRVAIISAEGAAGYGDFMNQLINNEAGIVFYTKLFNAVMQGAQVSATVRAAIEEIESMPDLFDCIVIIRGGGATTDLAGFDDLELARAVARCAIPVIVGIGHERDNTVLDFIAHTRVKTPTAAGAWLISQAEQALARAYDLATNIANYVKARLTGDERQLDNYAQMVPLLARTRVQHASTRLDSLQKHLPLLIQSRLQNASRRLERASRSIESTGLQAIARASARLDNFTPILKNSIDNRLRREQLRLSALADKVNLLSPQNILQRGYSITLGPDGRAIRSPKQAPAGTQLTTRLQDGNITSTVNG